MNGEVNTVRGHGSYLPCKDPGGEFPVNPVAFLGIGFDVAGQKNLP